MSHSPMTKIWYTILKPPNTASHPRLRELWTEVLAFCTAASGPMASGHTLWKDTTFTTTTSSSSSPAEILVMLSGYPSLASNVTADRAYVESGFMGRMAEYVEHGSLLQIDVDVNSLPLESEVLCIETYSNAPGEEGGGGGGGGGGLVHEGVELEKGGVREKTWVRLAGLRRGDVREIAKGRTERFQTAWVSRIME